MALTSIADLEKRWGAARVRQYLDDDGDGVADADPTADVIADTEGTVRGILFGKGYTAEHLTLLETDSQLRRLAAEIAIAFAAERKPEFLNNEGNGPFEKLRQRAIERLKLIASGELRIALEATQGERQNLRAEEAGREPKFLVAESAANPRGPGGF